MLRSFDGVRIGRFRATSAERAFPDIGLQALADQPRIDHASPGALCRALQAATRSDHIEVQRFTARLSLETRKDYTFFLNMHHDALLSLRGDWREADQADFGGMLKSLQEDRQALGAARLKLQPMPRAPLVFGNRLGVAYVIRQGRLDAQTQRRRIPKGFPTAYLDFSLGLTWPAFLLDLERGADGPRDVADDEVLRGARVAFELLVGILRQARI